MGMKMKIDFSEPIIKEEEVLGITPTDLNGFYASASDFDRTNLFFILLTSLQHYEGEEESEKAAHLSFLAAYYLFVPLTPPGSCLLALHYIRKAIALSPKEEYREWLALMEKGN